MFDFKITPDGLEPFEVTAGSRDVLKWERTTKGASFKGIAEDLKMTDMYKVAWIAAKRQGLYEGTLAEFEDDCEIDFEETDEPDPTRPAP
ncbi:hypothetical protein K1W54_28765 [Micromonospora sp. CPCC 205371]|nr:hypothetical protein [Micromonospora sp. CPCC 205371]